MYRFTVDKVFYPQGYQQFGRQIDGIPLYRLPGGSRFEGVAAIAGRLEGRM